MCRWLSIFVKKLHNEYKGIGRISSGNEVSYHATSEDSGDVGGISPVGLGFSNGPLFTTFTSEDISPLAGASLDSSSAVTLIWGGNTDSDKVTLAGGSTSSLCSGVSSTDMIFGRPKLEG